MTKDEALTLALEALEELVEFVPLLRPTCLGDERAIGHRIDRATTAIIAAKEALEKPARDWVSLEDEEVIRLAKHYRHAPISLILTVEALFKDMNHG